MARSLRWRLQAWHAAVLFVVLALFGGAVHRLVWTARLQQIDADLDHAADVLTSRLRRLAPFPQFPGFRFPGRPPGGGSRPERPAADGRFFEWSTQEPAIAEIPGQPLPEAAPDRRAPGQPGGANSRPWPWAWPWGARRGGTVEAGDRAARDSTPPDLELPDDFSQRFAAAGASPWYYAIWDREGKLLVKSDAAPDLPFPNEKLAEGGLPVQTVRERGDLREVVHVSRFEMNVLVGRSLAADAADHRRGGLVLAAIGLAVWGAGLVGGWWSTSRAMRPIAAMTRAAEEISERNLSRRIDVARTDDELGQLAGVLNGAFDRLEEAVERQTQFTADASHELRTPVAVILASADFALARPRDATQYRDALESCRRASQRMKALIERLLTLARFDAGEPALTLVEVEATQLAREVASLLSPLAEPRGMRLNVTGEPVVLRADRDRLSEVLMNLVSNGIRHGRDGGEVRIEVRRDGPDHVVLSVADDGAGIAPEHLPRLFERFYRVDKARARTDGGSGLGLAICRTIVEAHGGTICARSPPGAGATFEVRLPTSYQWVAGAPSAH